MYKLLNPIPPETVSKTILRSDGAYIPFDPNNQDFVEYQKWLAAGNTPLPAVEPA